ncbi:MAG: cation diffusion facilitator family transporter, partial [Candidatus Bathyarchaeia archaeon]
MQISAKAGESAAKKGIFAGALLTAIEVTGGLISGSLGLISSALNTLMNFIAAVIMFFAVREGSKPPDEIHMYGHEKIEPVAAIVEILLLFIVCSWITYSALSRLMSGVGHIELFWIALGTNFISILIDIFVYLNLKSSSKKRKSEAIDAGALHFMNDLLVAFVVIAGLVLYWFGVWYADSIAALGIVVFIIYSSFNVVRDSFATLMDTAPRGVVEQLRKQILSFEGVEDCHHIRARRVGSK